MTDKDVEKLNELIDKLDDDLNASKSRLSDIRCKVAEIIAEEGDKNG